ERSRHHAPVGCAAVDAGPGVRVSAICYLDTSALAKLVIAEPESDALHDRLVADGSRVVTSLVGAVELERACRRVGVPPHDVERVLDDVVLLTFDVAVAAVAG